MKLQASNYGFLKLGLMKTWIGIYISNISKVNEGIFWVTLVSAILLWGFLGVINFLTINIFNVRIIIMKAY